MSHYASYADVIDKDQLKKLCPKSYKLFKKELKAIENELNPFDICETDSVPDSFKNALNALQSDFNKTTGLSIVLMHRDDEAEGDFIPGYFFHVEGVYELTPAAKKLKKYIDREFWVVYG